MVEGEGDDLLTWRSIRLILNEGGSVPPASSAVHEPLWKWDPAIDLHGTGLDKLIIIPEMARCSQGALTLLLSVAGSGRCKALEV